MNKQKTIFPNRKGEANANFKHGLAGTSTHNIWVCMRQRCINSNCSDYKYYGGRGIFVCKRWGEFKNFLEDMGEKPAGLTLDRIDNEDGYYKANCKWSTRKEQSNNQRGKKLSKDQVSEIKILIKQGVLIDRIIAKMYGVHRKTVNKIRLGQIWTYT